ncbi:RNA-binding protein [Aquimarina intermedia]|uniref:HTH cro/C1-type domain-containing protein n=1 Tax=Aquimarina intermedia TaxID=350814 RepID=A0A5S5C0L2_9FLAO|nr:hypothetical protein [Aquimarina intermedia]TYP72827.1 hypothetical protein BD809_10675 [Aquimarina intermedia]
MVKSKGLNRILEEIDKRGLSAYKISQHTNLTPKGIRKIKDRATENPRIATLNEIASFLGISTNTDQTSSITNRDTLNDEDLVILSYQVKKNWNQLLRLEDFKPFFFYQIAKTLDMEIEDIFTAALNKGK